MTEPIRLGLMPPLTGLVAMYGEEIVRAARIARAEINARGGLLGRPLELIVEDDGSLPETAVPAALRLIEEHRCVAIIGNLLSNSGIAVASRVAEPKGIPYLNFSFYEGSISVRHFFHFAALPNQQIDKMIPFMARRYGPKMFFAGNNDEWPRGSIDAAKRALAAFDGDCVGEEYLPIGASVTEIEGLLEQVARSGCDVFVPYFAGADQITLLTRFAELGLKKRMAVGMGHYDEIMASHLPPAVREGFYSSNTYFMTVDSAENRAMLRQIARHPGVNGLWPAGNGILTNFGEGAYLCVHAFANAVERAGSTASEALVQALEHVCVNAPQGWVEMDPGTHHAAVNGYLARCDAEGRFVLQESFGRIVPQIPERYCASRAGVNLHESQPSPEAAARIAAQLAAGERRLGTAQRILSIADMGILATDTEGIIHEANPSAGEIFGYHEDELLGLSVHELVPPHFRQQHVELLHQFVIGSKTERKRAEEEPARRATHDPLTGLPNRALMRERIANEFSEKNRASGISGCLVYQDGCFMQMLEGTGAALYALMDRIRADSRHHDLRIVIEGPARRRMFPDWGMAVRDLDNDTALPEFGPWQHRRIDFMELADDARACYAYITAYANSCGIGRS